MTTEDLYNEYRHARLDEKLEVPPEWAATSPRERRVWKTMLVSIENQLLGTYEERRRAAWDEHCRRANEPEGRTTGLHRDSMG